MNFAVIIALASALSFVVTANGEPAMFTPLARDIAAATGFVTLVVLAPLNFVWWRLLGQI